MSEWSAKVGIIRHKIEPVHKKHGPPHPNKWLVTAIVLLSVAAIALACCRWAGRTRIAIVNYNVITQMQMSRANDNPSIVIADIAPEELSRLRRCDMVLVNGMGLKLTEARRTGLLGISESVPVLTVMATNPANDIVSLDSTLAGPVYAYLTP